MSQMKLSSPKYDSIWKCKQTKKIQNLSLSLSLCGVKDHTDFSLLFFRCSVSKNFNMMNEKWILATQIRKNRRKKAVSVCLCNFGLETGYYSMFVFLLLASLFLTWLLTWAVAAAAAAELSTDVWEFIIHFCLQLHEKYHIYFRIILFSCFDAVFAARIFLPLPSCVCVRVC